MSSLLRPAAVLVSFMTLSSGLYVSIRALATLALPECQGHPLIGRSSSKGTKHPDGLLLMTPGQADFLPFCLLVLIYAYASFIIIPLLPVFIIISILQLFFVTARAAFHGNGPTNLILILLPFLSSVTRDQQVAEGGL